MTDDIDWTRLARYFSGECSPDEAEETRRWIQADPERRRVTEDARAIWNSAGRPSTGWDTSAAWRGLAARLHSRERRASPALVLAARPNLPRTLGFRAAPRAAVVVAAVLTLAIGLWWSGRISGAGGTVSAPAPLREVRVPLGQRARFQLTDGTGVLLAPGSVLRYDTTSFGDSIRELWLDGRAHLTVTHDASRPFIVRTSRTVTEDLGTEFVITDYAADPASEVVVASGTVVVRSLTPDPSRPATLLRRGELMRLDLAGRVTVRREVDLQPLLAWTEGRLVFADTPVAEVVTQLNRWYGGDVRLGDEALSAHRFTGSYLSEPEATVVRELAAAVGAVVERRGNAVVLIPLSDRSRGR